MPRKGDIAVCSKGSIGLITADGPQLITYDSDNTSSRAYIGIHLTDKIAPIGSPWSSRNPRVFAHIAQDGLVFSAEDAVAAGITLIEQF